MPVKFSVNAQNTISSIILYRPKTLHSNLGTRSVLIAGQFTQLVWKGSHSMGIAMVKGKSGRIVIVANYNPPGNIMGQFMDNVLKPN